MYRLLPRNCVNTRTHDNSNADIINNYKKETYDSIVVYTTNLNRLNLF